MITFSKLILHFSQSSIIKQSKQSNSLLKRIKPQLRLMKLLLLLLFLMYLLLLMMVILMFLSYPMAMPNKLMNNLQQLKSELLSPQVITLMGKQTQAFVQLLLQMDNNMRTSHAEGDHLFKLFHPQIHILCLDSGTLCQATDSLVSAIKNLS